MKFQSTLLLTAVLTCLFSLPSFAQLKVAADGKVGIAGITTPAQPLDVNGNTRVRGQFIQLGQNAGTAEASVLAGFGRTGTGSAAIRFYNTFTTFNNWGTTFGLDASGGGGLFHQAAGPLGIVTIGTQNLQMGVGNAYKFTILGSNGNVGINTTAPAFQLEVNGSAAKPGGGDWTATSDRRAKKDIHPFEDGLEEVLKLNPVYFKYNGEAGTKDDGKEYVGVIAQEIQKVAPYTVTSFTHKTMSFELKEGNYLPTEKVVKEEEFLAVDASAVRYMLVNAIKEQQKMIDEKDAQINALEERLAKLELQFERLSVSTQSQTIQIGNTSSATLLQNEPNPFSSQTTIRYNLPQGAQNATMTIQDGSGRTMKTVKLQADAQVGEVIVQAGELAPGTYSYSLVVDGKVVDTKKMVLTR